MEGKTGVYTDVYLVKPFSLDEADGVGDKAICEHIKADIRKVLEPFAPGSVVEVVYDSGRKGKAVLSSIAAASKK